MKIHFVAWVLAVTSQTAQAQWQAQTIETEADFRGLAVVNENVVWVSGTKGTFGRTVDGGKTWQAGVVPGTEKLDFRDVEAFSESVAYLLSSGPGENSRIYKTTDGGKSWRLQFRNADADAFYDAIAFWDEKCGIALSDPVNGQFKLLATNDGGASWKPLLPKELPAAREREGAFAASGSCLITQGENDAWFVTGGAKARVFHSADRGKTWSVQETPIASGEESAGAFSIAFRDRDHGVIVGGDYRNPTGRGATAAITQDGGKTWKLVENQLPFRSSVVWAQSGWIAVGTTGSNISEEGRFWKMLDETNCNVVRFGKSGGWAAGPKGTLVKWGN